MYKLLKIFLNSGTYTKEDGQQRIELGVASGKVTPEQAEELLLIVEEKGLEEMVTTKSLDERVTDIESGFEELALLVSELVETVIPINDDEDEIVEEESEEVNNG